MPAKTNSTNPLNLLKSSSVRMRYLLVSIFVLFAFIAFLNIVVFQTGRESSIRRTVHREWQQLNISAPYKSDLADNLHCRHGDGSLGGPRGYYCIGSVSQTYGFYEDEKQAESIVFTYLNRNGWRSNPSYSSDFTKDSGKETLIIQVSSDSRSMYEKADLSPYPKTLGEQIYLEQQAATQKIFQSDPKLQTLVTVVTKVAPK